MTHVLYLSLDEGVIVIRCFSEKVGISVIESLPGGGVRLVCKSNAGAERIRHKLSRYVMDCDAKEPPHESGATDQ
jgi:hypothetical protein